jgi:hypothetical protein
MGKLKAAQKEVIRLNALVRAIANERNELALNPDSVISQKIKAHVLEAFQKVQGDNIEG